MTGITRLAIEEFAIEHDPPSDPRRDGHRTEVRMTLSRAQPTLRQGERLGVEIAVHRQLSELMEPST